MKQKTILLIFLAVIWGEAHAAPAPTNPVAASRALMIDPSSMPITSGKATLIIGALQRTNGVYSGDYRIKVFPWFLKSEKGRLAIVVSDASLAEVTHGKVATIIGTATTTGNGRSRHIDATATPADFNRGKLKLWFMAGTTKMTFEPAYHFAGKEPAMVSAQLDETKLVYNSPRQQSLSHPQTLATTVILP